MASRCTVCPSKNRAAIEQALAQGLSLRDIARQFPRFSKDSLHRHAKNCVAQALEKAAAKREEALGDRLLAEMERLHQATEELRLKALNEGELRTALRAIAEARRNVALVARMVGRLDPVQEQDKFDGRLVTWEELQVLYRRRTVRSREDARP